MTGIRKRSNQPRVDQKKLKDPDPSVYNIDDVAIESERRFLQRERAKEFRRRLLRKR